MTEEKKKNIKLQMKNSDVAAGSFANSFSITFSEGEFIVDFIMMQPQGGVGMVTNRVIMTPGKVNDLSNALREALKAWENLNNSSGTVQ